MPCTDLIQDFYCKQGAPNSKVAYVNVTLRMDDSIVIEFKQQRDSSSMPELRTGNFAACRLRKRNIRLTQQCCLLILVSEDMVVMQNTSCLWPVHMIEVKS